ncbi:MAG: hypothetical protein NTV40_06640 [Solirubrobacterales bacterium]|nr:hypothetical protein [Solirubrobacterales bacterium]
MPDSPAPQDVYTDEQLDAAVAGLDDPARLQLAEDLVARAAPQLQRILNSALNSGGWFGAAHEAELLKAAGHADIDTRLVAVGTLVAEETRMSMFVGVAVGFALARDLHTIKEEK